MHTEHTDDANVALTGYLLAQNSEPVRLERLVSELSLLPGIQAVHWFAGESTDPAPPVRPPA